MKINPFEMNEHEGTNFYHEHLQSDVDEGYPEIMQLDDCKYIFADEFKDRNNHLKKKKIICFSFSCKCKELVT